MSGRPTPKKMWIAAPRRQFELEAPKRIATPASAYFAAFMKARIGSVSETSAVFTA